MTPDPGYCREKALQSAYLIDIKKGFRKVLDEAEAKHKKMKTVPEIRVINMLVNLLSL